MQAYAGRKAHCRLRSLAHAAAVRRNPITAGALRGVNSETVRWTVSGRGQRLHSSRGKNYFAFKFWGRNNSSGVPNGNAAPARESLPYGKTLAFPPVRACVRNSIVKTLRLRASLRSWLTPTFTYSNNYMPLNSTLPLATRKRNRWQNILPTAWGRNVQRHDGVFLPY